jgi:hypothetical protein
MFSWRWIAAHIGLRLVIVVVGLVPICWAVVHLKAREKAHAAESDPLRPIADAALKIARASQERDGDAPPPATLHPSGTALIWDVPGNKISPMHYQLREERQARATDPEITVFLIDSIRSRQVGQYFGLLTPENQFSYQDTVRVVAVYWPEKTVMAVRNITGDMPPENIVYRNGVPSHSTHGDYTSAVLQWIIAMQTPALAAAAAHPATPSPPPASSPLPVTSPRAVTSHPPVSPSSWPLEPHKWTEAEARAEAVRRYPQLGIAGSPMNKAFLERYNQLKAEAPDYLQAPDWPLRLAAEVAR